MLDEDRGHLEGWWECGPWRRSPSQEGLCSKDPEEMTVVLLNLKRGKRNTYLTGGLWRLNENMYDSGQHVSVAAVGVEYPQTSLRSRMVMRKGQSKARPCNPGVPKPRAADQYWSAAC